MKKCFEILKSDNKKIWSPVPKSAANYSLVDK